MRFIRCEEGVSDAERIAVTGDVFNITGRLKEIDDRYFVMLNRTTGKFEVHVKGQLCTLGSELPYEQLDARALVYVREHDSSRADELLREILEREEQAERRHDGKIREAAERMADGLAFLSNKRTTDEFPEEAAEGFEI